MPATTSHSVTASHSHASDHRRAAAPGPPVAPPTRPWHRIPARFAAPGWRRAQLLRRLLAGLLAALALVLALSPDPAASGSAVVVTTRDLPAGATLAATDLAVRTWPGGLVPAGALGSPDDAQGRVLAGAARAGEPLTDLRLAGPALAVHATGSPDAVSVPVRLADPGVAALLTPGSTVDIVTAGPAADEPVLLARGAVVVTVLPADSGGPGAASRGRLVLVALPAATATRLAAASLSQQVALTLR